MHIAYIFLLVFSCIFSFHNIYGRYGDYDNHYIDVRDDAFLLKHIGPNYGELISDTFKSSINGDLEEAIYAYSNDISKITYRRGSCGALIVTLSSGEKVVVKPMLGRDILMHLEILDRVKKSKYIQSFCFISCVYINRTLSNIFDDSFDRKSIQKDASYITFQHYINGNTGKKTIIDGIVPLEHIFSKLSDKIVFLINNGIALKDLHGYNWLYNENLDKIYLIDFDAKRVVLDDYIENAIDGYLSKVCRTLTSIELTENNRAGLLLGYSYDLFMYVEVFLTEFLNSAMNDNIELHNSVVNRLNSFLQIDDINSKIPIFGKGKDHFKMYFKNIFDIDLMVNIDNNYLFVRDEILDKLYKTLNNVMRIYEQKISHMCSTINAEINWLSEFGIKECKLIQMSNSHPFYVIYWLVCNIELVKNQSNNIDLSSCHYKCQNYFLKKIIQNVIHKNMY